MAITEAEVLAIQPNVYYTIDEAAKLLRVPSASVRRLLVERPIGVKIGRHWRILGAALLNLAYQEEETEAEQIAVGRAISASSLREIWENEADSVYDRL